MATYSSGFTIDELGIVLNSDLAIISLTWEAVFGLLLGYCLYRIGKYHILPRIFAKKRGIYVVHQHYSPSEKR